MREKERGSCFACGNAGMLMYALYFLCEPEISLKVDQIHKPQAAQIYFSSPLFSCAYLSFLFSGWTDAFHRPVAWGSMGWREAGKRRREGEVSVPACPSPYRDGPQQAILFFPLLSPLLLSSSPLHLSFNDISTRGKWGHPRLSLLFLSPVHSENAVGPSRVQPAGWGMGVGPSIFAKVSIIASDKRRLCCANSCALCWSVRSGKI